LKKLKIISIHQPGYLPWLGFFKKIMYSDTFVLLDNAKYVKQQQHNRNLIRTNTGSTFLTVPVVSNSGAKINEMKISYAEKWNISHKKTIFYNYNKTTYFDDYWSFFEELYNKKFEMLLDLNLDIINFLIKKLKIKTKIISASELGINIQNPNLEICKSLNADVFLAGTLGKNYINEDDFNKNGIKVEFQNFQHPIYKQKYEPFIPNIAAIDLLFNYGEKSTQILQGAKNF